MAEEFKNKQYIPNKQYSNKRNLLVLKIF